MLERNRLNPGDFVIPIPVGIPIKLIYNSSGVLSSMDKLESLNMDMSTLDVSSEHLSKRVIDSVTDCGMIPKSIPISGGTTIVCGIAVLDSYSKLFGQYPEAVFNFIDDNNFEVKEFHAFHVMSYAMNFSNMYAILNWLAVCKFSVLSGFLVPYDDMSRFEGYESDVLLKKTTIKYSMAYMIFNSTSKKLLNSNLRQGSLIDSPEEFINSNGVVMSRLHLTDGETLEIPFSVAKKFKLSENSIVYYLSTPSIVILDSEVSCKLFHKSTKYTERRCAICGSKLDVNQPVVRCSDEFCMSRQYNSYVHMMTVLNRPYVNFDTYLSYIMSKKGNVQLVDMLDMEDSPYEKYRISIGTILQSAIPTHCVGDRRVIDLFVSLCRNKWDTVTYYLKHSDRILVDFDFSSLDTREFIDCISDCRYAAQIESIYNHPKIEVCDSDKIYDADPILRGMKLCVTGLFQLGNYSDVKGVLSSYGAQVTDELIDGVNYVIVGDTYSDIDNVIVTSAINSNISVVGEGQFFEYFGIDKDIEENLLLKHNGGQ